MMNRKRRPIAAQTDEFEVPLIIDVGPLEQVCRIHVVIGLERRIQRLEMAEIRLSVTSGYLGCRQGLDRARQG